LKTVGAIERRNEAKKVSEERETAASIEIEARDGALLLAVKAQPGARKNELRGAQDGALKVCVTQVAEKGEANKAISEFLAKALKLRKSQIELASGELASQKKFRVAEIDETELRAKIEEALSAKK
jgi:uncharacterized protein (TIGR00251 family)